MKILDLIKQIIKHNNNKRLDQSLNINVLTGYIPEIDINKIYLDKNGNIQLKKKKYEK